MKLTMQTKKLKKDLLSYCKLKNQYMNGDVSLLDEYVEKGAILQENNLDIDVLCLNKYIYKFFAEKNSNIANCACDVLSYDSGKLFYPCDYDSVGAYREKKYKYYLDVDNTSYEFPMNNNPKTIALDTVLFNKTTSTLSNLIQDYPQIIDYVLKAYEDTKIARIESERAELIKRIVYMQNHAEELQENIIDLNRQLPLGKRVGNFIKEVLCIKDK